MSPASIVGPFQSSIFVWTELTSHSCCSLLRFTFPAEPGTSWDLDNSITSLMHGNITAVSVAVNQRVFGPASLIRANAATPDHLLHISGQIVAKYHLQTEIKSANVYIEASSRISRIPSDEKSISDVVSFTLASEGVAGSSQEKVRKNTSGTTG